MTGKQKKQFEEAFLSAFRNYSQLERMLSFIDIDLNSFSNSMKSMIDIVQDICNYGEENNKIKEILTGALEEVPGNIKLNEFFENSLTNKSEINVKGNGGIYIDNVPNAKVTINKKNTVKVDGNRNLILQDIETENIELSENRDIGEKYKNYIHELDDYIITLLKGNSNFLEEILETINKNIYKKEFYKDFGYTQKEYFEILKWLEQKEYIILKYYNTGFVSPTRITYRGEQAFKNKIWSKQKAETDKQLFVFLTADPKNSNPLKALEQKQIIEDIVKEKYEFYDNTKTFYNTIHEKTKNSSFVHITTHGKNNTLIFEHHKQLNKEAPVNADYLCFQLRKNNDKKTLIVLMACTSVELAKAIVEADLTKYAIGTNNDISTSAAVEFTEQFYKELLSNTDIKTAFDNTCIELNNNLYRAMHDNGDQYDYKKEFQLINK